MVETHSGPASERGCSEEALRAPWKDCVWKCYSPFRLGNSVEFQLCDEKAIFGCNKLLMGTKTFKSGILQAN